MRYFITFAYRGTDFHGSQTQPNGNTVQAEMEAAFATILREPVSLTFAGRTDAGVHADKARFDALARTYHYRITMRKEPFLCFNHTRVAEGLDFDAMNEAALYLLGKQDFASFCRAHTDAKTTICNVKEAYWTQENETEATFVITADRFLRNMVRAIVGTLFEVGRGKMMPEEMESILAARNRCSAGHSSPAEGLSLVEIIYPNNIYV